MSWSFDAPTEPGFYWTSDEHRTDGDPMVVEVRNVEVSPWKHALMIFCIGKPRPSYVDEWPRGWLWSERLEHPSL